MADTPLDKLKKKTLNDEELEYVRGSHTPEDLQTFLLLKILECVQSCGKST